MSQIDPRHLARLLALQVLYEADSSAHNALDIAQIYANIAIPNDDARISAFMAVSSFYDERIEWGEQDDLPLTDQTFLPPPQTYSLLLSIVNGVNQHRDVLDEIISTYAPEYPLEQLAVVDRNVLRIALFEISFNDQVPMKVAINEAVRIAKLYGADTTSSFVNGVLGVVADNYDKIKEQLGLA